MTETARSPDRLDFVELDAQSLGAGSPRQLHERQAAIADLLAANAFRVPGHGQGPYGLVLAIRDARLAFDIRSASGEPVMTHLLSLKPFRSILKDYLLLCESLLGAGHVLSSAQVEAIDMGRRGLHDEGAARLAERLEGKVEADFPTMRRLFTLLSALHWKG